MKHRLTAAEIRSATPPSNGGDRKLQDGQGMYLRVRASGSRSWYYQYCLRGGKQRTYCLGSYPEIGLKQARELLIEARAAVARGRHPIDEQRSKQLNSFEHVARDWISQKKSWWRSSYCKQVVRTLETNVFPKIGTKPISDISRSELLNVIQTIADRRRPPGKKQEREHGAITVAVFVRQLCSQVFQYAMARGLADRDIAADLKGAFVRRPVHNNPGLNVEELRQLIAQIADYRDGSHTNRATLIALELLVLTFVRTGELRLARWEEFDFDRRVWTVPAERMKAGRVHVVPLCPRALELLGELRQLHASPHWLFPNTRDRNRPMSATTINRVLERMKYRGRLSAHGLRSTASTVLHDQNFRHEIIEKQLSHETGNRVSSAYNKAEYLDQRRELMLAWSDIVVGRATEGQNVTPLRNAA